MGDVDEIDEMKISEVKNKVKAQLDELSAEIALLNLDVLKFTNKDVSLQNIEYVQKKLSEMIVEQDEAAELIRQKHTRCKDLQAGIDKLSKVKKLQDVLNHIEGARVLWAEMKKTATEPK